MVPIESPRNISLESLLGRMLKHWTESGWTKGKDKIMIKHCCHTWIKESILLPDVFWPKYEADEDWLHANIMLYVNEKKTISKEESDFAIY